MSSGLIIGFPKLPTWDLQEGRFFVKVNFTVLQEFS